MIKGFLLFLILLLSCNNIDNRQRKEFSEKDKAVNFAISNLKKLDTSSIYNLYYVIETEDNFLYVINTNKDNRLTFMYFFDTIGCKPIDNNEYIIYMSISSEISKPDNCVEENFNVIFSTGKGEPIKALNGMIFQKIIKKGKPEYSLVKKGNILEEVLSNPELIIQEVPEEDYDL